MIRLTITNKVKFVILLLGFLYVQFALSAQPVNYVNITTVQVIAPYNTRLSAYINTPSKIIIIASLAPGAGTYKFKLFATLTGDNGIQIKTNSNALTLLPQVTLSTNNPVQVLNATYIQNLFELTSVDIQGTTSNFLQNNGLPEGNYTLCIQAVSASGNPLAATHATGIFVSAQTCSNPFPVSNLEPPNIINPQCGSEQLALSPQNILFNWSLPSGAKPGINYDFKMVEIQDTLRDPNDAMLSATTPSFFETTVTSNVLLYGPANPTLTPGNRYAYMVTAYDPANNLSFRNSGRSEVCYFTYKPIKSVQVPLPIAVVSLNSNPNPNPGTNTGASNSQALNCTCSTSVSDHTVNNINAIPNSILHIGAFELTLNTDVQQINGLISGTGTIPVPFINTGTLNLLVEFSDLQVNISNQALAGTVRAKRNSNAAGIMPAYDNPNVQPSPFTTSEIENITSFATNIANNSLVNNSNASKSTGWTIPFGIQQVFSGQTITVVIGDVVFTPSQAGFNACLAYDMAEGGADNILPLGAKNICFKDSKNFCGNGVLFLAEDFPITSLNFTFLKSSGNGSTQGGTYALFDQNGFRQLHIKAEYDFSNNIIVRQSDKGVVKATIETDIKNWNNWVASVSIDPFSITGYDQWTFTLNNSAYYDHSDSINPPGMPALPIDGKNNFLDNTWQGFFIPDLQVSLPSVIQNADKQPLSVDVNKFIIDNEGITGDILANNVLDINNGSLGGWYYSIDNIDVRFVNSSYISGGMSGKVLLPTSGSPQQNPQDELNYTCTLSEPSSGNGSLNFQFVIQPKNGLHADLWDATVNLDPTSNITIANNNNNLNATANLNGNISIQANLSPIQNINLAGIQFQNIQLKTQSPYISSNATFSFASPDHSLAGFPVSITGITPVINGSSAGISFDLNISLTNISTLPSGTLSLGILGDVSITNSRPTWGNPHLQVNQISISGPLGPLDLSGNIDFFDNDPVYGNGIRGSIDANLGFGITQVDINSHILFGNTTFNYWYVDLNYLQITGIPLVPPVSLFGIGGGVFYNMSKGQDITPDALLKGTANNLNRYTPMNNTVGFTASIVVGLGDGVSFHAKGTLSMEFASQLGVKSVDLDVDAAFLNPVTGNDSKAPITGNGHIGYDFSQKIFDAGVGMNVNYTVITGNGWLNLNINGSNGQWYFKLGEPAKRINVNVLDLVSMNAYFMMGSNIPGIPNPPDAIMQAFPQYQNSIDYAEVSNQNEPGFAFGAGFQWGPNNLNWACFYMDLSAGLGFDMSLFRFTQGCNGNNNLPGINGWYANGQFYAWADFKFGISVNVWFFSGNIDVAEVKAAALFQAGLINPSWFDGWLYGYYNVLNGAISGNMNFHVSIGNNGNQCIPGGKVIPPVNPLGVDLPIISDLQPAQNTNNISIAENPQVAFNFPVGCDFDVKSTDNNNSEVLNTVHINITEFTIQRSSDHTIVADLSNNQNLSFSDQMKLATLYTKNCLDPQTGYTVTVSVAATDAKTMQVLTYKGKPVQESKSVSFKTGDCLHRLDDGAQTLLGSYPFKNQRYFLQKEQTTGFIQLNKSYPCLLNDPDYDLLAQFITYQTPSQTSVNEVKVSQNGDQLTFPIPSLANNQITELRIIKRRKNIIILGISGIEQSSTTEKSNVGGGTTVYNIQHNTIKGASISNKSVDLELYNYFFKTSKYNTLAEKLSDSDNTATATRDGAGNMEGYSVIFKFTEGFDVFDVNETTFDAFGDKFVIYPLVNISEQSPGNAWVQNYVNNNFYNNWKTAYIYGGDYKYDINPAIIRKSATGVECLTFQPSLEPVGILPMSADPPLSQQEISSATTPIKLKRI